jgi:hypothetical protein
MKQEKIYIKNFKITKIVLRSFLIRTKNLGIATKIMTQKVDNMK